MSHDTVSYICVSLDKPPSSDGKEPEKLFVLKDLHIGENI